MEPIYRETFRVAGNHVDRYSRLKPSALLDMLQQVATSQCALLDLGWAKMAERRLFWAVTRQHIQIARLPMAGETITLETWPGITSRVAYPRSTVAYDAKGNELFRAISLWVLMNMDSRTMVLPGKSGVEVTGIERGNELAVPGSLAPVKLAGDRQRTVVYSELDCNGHMSNTRYLDWMMDLLPSSFHENHPLVDFTVTYLSEAREGETVDLSYELTPEGQLRLEATTDQDGSAHRVFAVRAAFC